MPRKSLSSCIKKESKKSRFRNAQIAERKKRADRRKKQVDIEMHKTVFFQQILPRYIENQFEEDLCPFCNEKFESEEILENHVKSHSAAARTKAWYAQWTDCKANVEVTVQDGSNFTTMCVACI